MSIIKPPKPEPAYLQPFLAHCHRRKYPARTEFIHTGDPAESLFYLVNGSVTVMMEDEDEKEIILTYLNKVNLSAKWVCSSQSPPVQLWSGLVPAANWLKYPTKNSKIYFKPISHLT